jgi:hypothetical protein
MLGEFLSVLFAEKAAEKRIIYDLFQFAINLRGISLEAVVSRPENERNLIVLLAMKLHK